jgi:RND family efflux transporter MFP subunit
MNPLKLKTAIQERHAGLIKPGQVVEFVVEAFPGRTFLGKVAYVSPAVDMTTRTFPVEAIVDNSNRLLKPGFFTKGTVKTRLDEGVMAAPEEAISTLAGVSTVYVIESGKARQQQVALGVRQGKLVEITSGLTGNETLAASNLNMLATGTPVRVGGDTADPTASDGRRGGAQRGRGAGERGQGGRQ